MSLLQTLNLAVVLTCLTGAVGCGKDSTPAQISATPVNPAVVASHNAKQDATHPIKRVVFLGDSITWGIRVGTPGKDEVTREMTFTYAIQNNFPDKIFINSGVPGDTVYAGLGRFNSDVLAKKPDLLIVMFGTNDITRLSREDFEANMEAVITRALEQGIQVVLMTEPKLADEYNGNQGKRLNAILDSYMDVTRDLAARYSLPLVDNFKAWDSLDRDTLPFTMDGCHPNFEGHGLIVKTLRPVLADLF